MRPKDIPDAEDAIDLLCEGALGMGGQWARLWMGLKAQNPPTKLRPEVGVMCSVMVLGWSACQGTAHRLHHIPTPSSLPSQAAVVMPHQHPQGGFGFPGSGSQAPAFGGSGNR